ncbi:putative pentatricopeptide repeat-containing protein At5g08490 [Typha latifolia]|uniref:putative pentatricopeptide repeat-containing protein At5g08490 n=1 Tax=Typha latifolia TaxID=4733 RepID=UPI003C2E3257
MTPPHALKIFHLYSYPICVSLKPLFSSYGSKLRCLTTSVAHESFGEMPVPDYRSCNAMLKNYAANREYPEVVSLFRWMQDNKIRPDRFALAAAVKSSAVLLNAVLGKSLHGFAVKAGYAMSAAVEKALMDMYGRFGMLHESCEIFCKICQRDSVSWNIMLTAFARAGLHEDAVHLFCEMHGSSHEEIKLTAVTVAVILPICAKMKLLKFGVGIHGYAIKVGLESNTLAGNALMSMYAKCGRVMDDAHRAFCLIGCKDVVSWNSIIAGYSENGFFEEALQLFAHMVSIGSQPNYATIANVLPICAFIEDGRYYGKEVHCYVLHFGLEMDLSVCNALLTHYSKVGDMKRVEFLFEKMQSRDIVTWNTFIAGYAISGCHNRALDLFHELLAGGTSPDSVTFISVLPVFAQLDDIEEGRKIHAYVIQHPKLLQETSLMNALISFYGKCGELDDALLTFKRNPKRDLISWNAILSAYADNEQCGKFFDLLNEMNQEGIQPDSVTILSVLRLSTLCGIRMLREVHGYSFRTGFTSETAVVNAILNAYANCGNTNDAYKTFKNFTGKNVITCNTMISGYMKHGCQEDAEVIFGQMSQRDLTTWNLMVQVYAQNENTGRAFSLFFELQQEGIKPDAVSLTCILPACIQLTSIHLVRQCHGYALRSSLEDIHLEGALLDAYSKCGNTIDAYNLFRVSPLKDLVTFTAMVGCYAMHGMAEEAVRIFSQMLELNIKPDHVIMTALLSACSHAGMVDEGWKLFKSIREVYGIEPTMEHYACMVDILARGGRLREAYDFILDMPCEANGSVWGSLLGACKTHKEVEVARLVADHLFSIEAENIGNYVMMSNIYAADERWDGVEQVRRLMKSKYLKKPAGCSWIEVEKTRHFFVAGDLCHPKRLFIYGILKTLDRQIKDPSVLTSEELRCAFNIAN